jgi:hypothetical protein
MRPVELRGSFIRESGFQPRPNPRITDHARVNTVRQSCNRLSGLHRSDHRYAAAAGRYHRPDNARLIDQGIACGQDAGASREFRQKFVGHQFDHHEPLGRHANIAFVEERSEDGGVDRTVDVCVIQDDQPNPATSTDPTPAGLRRRRDVSRLPACPVLDDDRDRACIDGSGAGRVSCGVRANSSRAVICGLVTPAH